MAQIVGVRVEFNAVKVAKRLSDFSDEQIKFIMPQILDDCNYFAKHDSGELISSSYIASDFSKGKLIWETDYARYQYYLPTSSKDKNSHASMMWAEKAKIRFSKDWIAQLQKRFDK